MHHDHRPAGDVPAYLEARSASFLSAPGFGQSVGVYCREMTRADPEDWMTAKLFHQFGRYMVSFLLIHHYQDWRYYDGAAPTLRRLQTSSPLSARQTAAIVAGLRAGKLVTASDLEGSRRVTLAPTPKLTTPIASSMIAFLRAGDRLEAERPPLAPFFADNTDMQQELVFRSAQFVFEHGNLLDACPRIRTFADKDCGYLILSAVMASLLGAAGEPLLSCRRLARHFGISRSHVSNLVGMAAGSGWFATDGHGRLNHVSLDFVDEYRRWAASELAHYATLAEAILASSDTIFQA